MLARKVLAQGNRGFSLVELMVVVAIIGVLAALAVPRFQTFQAKARAAESTNNLSHAYTLQMVYHGDNDTYGSLEQIGFALNGQNAVGDALNRNLAAKIRYSYANAPAVNTFTTTATAATGDLGSCQNAPHVVIINQNKAIGPTVTAASTQGAPTPIPGC